MKATSIRLLLTGIIILHSLQSIAWQGMPLPRLRVEGRYLKDPHGNVVNLHGVALTPNPWFNGGAFGIWRWRDFDIQGCLHYNKTLMDVFTDTTKGWWASYIRLHIDPHWTNTPGGPPIPESDISRFDFNRLGPAMRDVIIPLINHAAERGLYVVLRPPGVCPELIAVGDAYHQYLIRVWDFVSSMPEIQNADHVMFKLANEPVNIVGTDGTIGSNTQPHFDALKLFFQPIVDLIRANGFRNVIWIPGLGWQSHFRGFAINPIEGENIGYAAHIYPGYWGGIRNYEAFRRGWNENIKPVADFAPILVCEIDWSPTGEHSWGVGITGVAGGEGFGANFRKITKESGNVSWNLLGPDNLLHFGDPHGPLAYGGDPEACAYPARKWIRESGQVNFPRPDFAKQSLSDNRDGTFTNPVLHADFPDPDVIRVDDFYYMVSTTNHIFPGASMLKSRDLINWEFVGNPLEMIEPSDAYNLTGGQQRYGRGMSASSLRYHNGKFHILFSTPDEGTFLLTATNPGHKWTIKRLSRSFYDPGLLFADGRIFVVHIHIHNLAVTELNHDFEPIGTDHTIITQRPGKSFEGPRIYRINGFYFIYAAYSGLPATQAIFRSDNIFGPYVEGTAFDDDNIHNGSLVETQTGQWWTILTQETGPMGHVVNLQPVMWINNWPIIGSAGRAVVRSIKPDVGTTHLPKVLPTNDNFRNFRLGAQWGWNHNPDNTKWCLFERPGFLRLHTASVASGLLQARNTLTQRIFGYHSALVNSFGTIKMNIAHMQEGDVAGLAVFHDPYALIGIRMAEGAKRLKMVNAAHTTIGPVINDSIVYLRAVVNSGTGRANFFYSLDNKTYTPFGTAFNMGFNPYFSRGNMFSVFNYATETLGGFVDVDWFSTEEVFNENMFYDDSFIGFTKAQLTLDTLTTDSENIEMLVGTTRSLQINALFRDGSSENVAREAAFSISNPHAVRIVNGQLIAINQGEATVTATYTSKLDESKSVQFNVSSMVFPLTNELFNPSIFASGTFNEVTRRLITGQWGFGGWRFENGINLSGYRYLVVRLQRPTTSGASFRIFDTPSYWSDPVMVEVGNRTHLVIDLHNMTKTVGGQPVIANPSHIYIVGFWSHGGIPIDIESVYLSDAIPTSVTNLYDIEINEDDIVDVISITGVKLRTGVVRRYATQGLSPGIYIIGNQDLGYQKVFVGFNEY